MHPSPWHWYEALGTALPLALAPLWHERGKPKMLRWLRRVWPDGVLKRILLTEIRIGKKDRLPAYRKGG